MAGIVVFVGVSSHVKNALFKLPITFCLCFSPTFRHKVGRVEKNYTKDA
jgi:hypothetical protein